MVTSLFKYEQIETTDTKAKQIKPIAEKMITLAKRSDLHARRLALSYMTEKTVTHKLFEEAKERYLDRQGGYLRIIKKGVRKGDGAPISVVQLIQSEESAKGGKKKSKKTAPKKAVSKKTKAGDRTKPGQALKGATSESKAEKKGKEKTE
jgi:large subunit ribosomal protein L17